MYAMQKRNSTLGLGVTTAMAAVMLSGCATGTSPHAAVSANAGQSTPMTEHDRAIQAAEAAVAANPRSAQHRMALGNAYLEGGRFASASTTFEDAMALGDNSPRAALSLTLALIGQARYSEAGSLLSDWEGQIAASDLGLALALSGQPERGIHILTNSIRGGENTVKSRQNLAYAYAVAGRWREARMMVAQDVPAHEVGQRIAEWSQLSNANAYQARIANLLGVPANVRDDGQPVHLALANGSSAPRMAADMSSQRGTSSAELAALDAGRMSVPATGSELPSVGAPRAIEPYQEPAPVTTASYAPARDTAATGFAEAFAPSADPGQEAPAIIASDDGLFLSAPAARYAPQPDPVAGPLTAPQIAGTEATEAPARTAARSAVSTRTPAIARPALVETAIAAGSVDAMSSHLVQLGSFSSEAGANRAWDIYVARYPELADREKVITQAVVNGRNYWRVSAGGFDGSSSRAMCNFVDSSNGEGCISWVANSPLPGAIETGVRFAHR